MGEITNALGKAKAWYNSRTIIATILGVLSTILGLFGYDIGDVVNVAFDQAGQIAEQVDSIWVSLQAVFFAILAAWGRVRAEVKIKTS
jgi:hypothetical protein